MLYATLNLRDDGGVNGYLTENPGKPNQHTVWSGYAGTARYDHPIRATINQLKNQCHALSVQPDLWEVYGPRGGLIYSGESIDEFGSVEPQ